MRFVPQGLENGHLLPILLVGFLPILLHLLDRRRARVVEWPAMLFLARHRRAHLRRMHRREGLLILTRSLAALLIACAVLQPVSTEVLSVSEAAAARRGLLLIVDTSYSMAYREQPEGPTALEKARNGALEILDGLGRGDQAMLLTAAGQREPVAAEPFDVDAVRRAVRDLRFQGAGFRLLEAIDAAADIARRLSTATREICIFTDLERSSLPDRDPGRWRFAGDRLRALRPAPVVRLFDCGARASSNHFIAALEPPALAATTDEPVRLKAAVESRGEAGGGRDEEGSARLLAGGKEVAALSIRWVKGGSLPLEFTERFPDAGDVPIAVQLPEDHLPEDDTRRLVLEVLGRLPILLAGTSLDGSDPGTARYLDLALAPRAPDLTAPPVIFRPEFTANLGGAPLADYRVVILAGLPRRDLDDSVPGALAAFVRAGGGLLIFAGSEVEPHSLMAALSRREGGILPARLAGRRPAEVELHPRDLQTAHPALAQFADPEQGDLGRVTIRRFGQVADLAPETVVLARVGTESPWMLERPVGKGKVILVTTSAASDDSDLPRTPLFLPLLHHLVRYLASRAPSSRNLQVGEPISVHLPADAPHAAALLIDPRGARHPLSFVEEEGRLQATFTGTEEPGFYTMEFPGGGEPLPPQLFALNIPLEESRLERLDQETVAELGLALDLEVKSEVGEAARRSVATPVKGEHWPRMLLLALGLLFAELVLARGLAAVRMA